VKTNDAAVRSRIRRLAVRPSVRAAAALDADVSDGCIVAVDWRASYYAVSRTLTLMNDDHRLIMRCRRLTSSSSSSVDDVITCCLLTGVHEHGAAHSTSLNYTAHGQETMSAVRVLPATAGRCHRQRQRNKTHSQTPCSLTDHSQIVLTRKAWQSL